RRNARSAVDQRPHLQDRLPVDALRLYRADGNVGDGNVGDGNEPVLTGPASVTEADADAVGRLAANGAR
ncbi:sugar ABC transporter substrate-binding protein, partial [Streptomyces sp. TRM76130]|nr:sugar ABC transporter substrate-binding protein [Streptomyces sp. TRM76130]